jgi:hypothetical protein
MRVNEYKFYVSIQKSLKDAEFGQSVYVWVPLCYEQNDVQNGVEIIFKDISKNKHNINNLFHIFIYKHK